jgi:hypothetical protein
LGESSTAYIQMGNLQIKERKQHKAAKIEEKNKQQYDDDQAKPPPMATQQNLKAARGPESTEKLHGRIP